MTNHYVLRIVSFELWNGYLENRLIYCLCSDKHFRATNSINRTPKLFSAICAVYTKNKLELLWKDDNLLLKIETLNK